MKLLKIKFFKKYFKNYFSGSLFCNIVIPSAPGGATTQPSMVLKHSQS